MSDLKDTAESRHLAELLDELGLGRGAHIAQVQRRLGVGMAKAMRLLALREAIPAALTAARADGAREDRPRPPAEENIATLAREWGSCVRRGGGYVDAERALLKAVNAEDGRCICGVILSECSDCQWSDRECEGKE